MKKIIKKTNDKKLQAFFLSFALGLIITLPNIIMGKGIFSLVADFNIQQIPFNKIVNYSLKHGKILWTWYNELGSNFIGTFSFYNLFSPFNILGYLFPSNWYEYLIGPTLILKYGIAGLTSYMFISRYTKNNNNALIGSLLYSFSGFQLTNILFYHFHDVVAFFPLILYSLDKLVYDNKKGLFLFSVALCAFTNWFFFIGEVVFTIIYFFIKLIMKDYKVDFNKFKKIFIEALLGTLLAAVVLIPSCLFTMGNPRVNGSWSIITMLKYYYKTIYLENIRAFLFPPEVMYPRSLITNMNYSSVELYLPVVGITLIVPYILKNKSKWPSVLFILCGIFMIIPILNSSFFAFKNNYYARWFYMPLLIMSLISSLTLDKNYKIKSGIITTIIGYLIFGIGLFLYKINHTVFFDKVYFILTIIFSLLGIIMIITYNKIKSKDNKSIILIIFIFIFVGFWGNYMIYMYKNKSFNTPNYYLDYLHNNKQQKIFKNVRTNSANNCPYNLGYIFKINNLKSFNSNINAENFNFYYSLDYYREVSTIIDESDKYMNDYLGVKYIISCGDDHLEDYGYKFIYNYKNYKIYLNPDYKKFGFAKNEYIDNKDFKNLSLDEKKLILNNKIVLNEKQIKKYNYFFDENIVSYNYNKFKYKKNGFISKIYSNKDTLAIYTFPYDKGWTAKVNGKYTKIEKVDNGMMAVKIDKGSNIVELSYTTPGLKLGGILSMLSAIATILYLKRK